MDSSEQDFIEFLAGEAINPKTIAEYNAWIDIVSKDEPDDFPEQKLLRAIAASLRIDEVTGQQPLPRWNPVRREQAAEVIPFGAKKRKP